MQEHTSTPWRLASHNPGTYSILAEEGPITVCPAIPTGYADGTFIVRACNAHADLVKALTAASHALKSYQYGNSAIDLAKVTAEMCDAVISKAGA